MKRKKKADYLHVKGYLQTMGHMHNHELGEHYDRNLKHKQFMLEVYEKIDANAASMWSSKVKAGREIKAEVLLDFCKADKWKQNKKEVIIERFIVVAAVSFKDGKLTENTTAMSKLIENLNKSTISDIVKLDFAKALGMNTKDLNPAQLTFKKEDFKVMLENNKDKINLGSVNEI